MSEVTFVGTAQQGNINSVTYTAPLSGVAGRAAGDYAIVGIATNLAAAVTVPGGWTPLADVRSPLSGARAIYLRVYGKRIVAGEPDPVFTMAGTVSGSVTVDVYRDVQSWLVTTASGGGSGSGYTVSIPGFAGAPAGSVDYASCGEGSDALAYPTLLSGFTIRNTSAYNGVPFTTQRTQDKAVPSATDLPAVSLSAGNAGSYQLVAARILLLPNRPPDAPTLTSPPSGSSIDLSVTQRFAWAFSDPDPGDSQSKFDLQYRVVGAPAWTAVSGTTPNAFWDAPAGTFAAGDYEWQVRTYDAQGLVGPYSQSGFFTAAVSPGGPTITAPTSGAAIATSTAALTWSAPSQTAYQVRRVADNAGVADTATVYWDSGEVTDSTTRSIQVAFPTNNRWEHVQVRVKDGGLWGPWADVRVQVSWTSPAVASAALTTYPNPPTIAVAVTNPQPATGEPSAAYNNIWLRAGGVSWRAATMVLPNSSWTFWTPASGVDYEVQVETVATNGTTSTTDWVGAAAQGLDYSYGGGYS